VTLNKHSLRLRFVRRNGTVVHALEKSFAVAQADYHRWLLVSSSIVFVAFLFITIAFDLANYAKDRTSLFLRLFLCKAITALLAVVVILFSRSRYYRASASQIMTHLGFWFMVSLVVYSLWLGDAQYDVHIAFMLYLFTFMPIQTYTATGIALLQISSFSAGHFILGSEDAIQIITKTCFLGEFCNFTPFSVKTFNNPIHSLHV